jgi:rod shape determining protein RodA
VALRRVPVLAYDWVLISLVLLISFIGLVTLYSAVPSRSLWLQQLVALPIALAVGLLIQLFTRRQVLSWGFTLYMVSLAMLVLVLLIGREINGARAWFNLGPFSFQPLELAKIGLILVLARALAARPLERLLDYVLPVLLTVPVLALVFIQPDLGGALVLIAGFLGMLFVRGMPVKHIALGAVLLAVLLPTAVWSKDPKGRGFQQIQSTIAIGSGGLMGKGFGAGTQTQLGFVPERQTDFIYAVLAEEWGFVGATTLIALYALLFFRLGRMASECVRMEDRLIIAGVLSMLAFQVTVNIAVTLGLAPVTGLTLPLVSKGGSSLIMVYLGLGLALLVHRDRYSEV